MDGSQARGVNRLQCARLLFLRCVSAADELAGSARACAAGSPGRRPTHGSRLPLIRRRGLDLLFHHVMVRQASLSSWAVLNGTAVRELGPWRSAS